MPRRIAHAWLLAAPLLFALYLYNLSGPGMLGPDEPRYASIGREMARTGDWITPRLWGDPWFEKPALLYWMTGFAFRFGLGEDLAPRLPVALVSVAFLIFFQRMARAEFGDRAAWYSSAILATSAGWIAYSHVGVTDLPMSAAFAAAMLLGLRWLDRNDRTALLVAGALMGAAVLAKGLVPLVLALPLLWFGRRRSHDLIAPTALLLAVAAPWYLLCYFRNGPVFVEKFFWEHHFGRFASDALQHRQPFWFYIPVIAVAMFPWSPALFLALRGTWDRQLRFLAAWALFGFVFFSASTNKLPGYILPLLPALALLTGVRLATRPRARWILAACAALLIVIPPAAQVLPGAIAAGLSRVPLPGFHWGWLAAAAAGPIVFALDQRKNRAAAVAVLCVATAAAMLFLETEAASRLDRAVSARPLWREIAGRRSEICIGSLHRAWRYGLNYYSETPLPDCDAAPKALRIEQQGAEPPKLIWSSSTIGGQPRMLYNQTRR